MHTNIDSIVYPFAGSRTVQLAGLASLSGAIKSNTPVLWRLVVKSDRIMRVEATITQSNTSRTISFIVAQNSTETFNGFGNVSVKLINQESDVAKVDISLEPQVYEDSYQIEGDRQNIDSTPAYIPLNPNNGYAPNLCNYCTIYASDECSARIIDLAGNVIYDSGNVLVTDQWKLRNLRVPKNCRVTVKNKSAGTAVNFIAVWYRSK